MESNLSKKIYLKKKEFKKWVHSDKFSQFIAKFIALFVIAIMILVALVPMLQD